MHQASRLSATSAARRLWPGQDAIGQRLREPTYRTGAGASPTDAWQTVVGVVQDVRFRGLNDVRLDLYVPDQSSNRASHLLVRFEGAEAGGRGVRAAAQEVEPTNVATNRRVDARECQPRERAVAFPDAGLRGLCGGGRDARDRRPGRS